MKKAIYYAAPSAVVCGDVSVGEGASFWHNAVVRGDCSHISIGRGTNIQDNCVLHSTAGSPLTVKDFVTVGHGALLHGCTIGSGTLIGMGSIVLDDARIGENCLIGAGSLVTGGKVIPDGHLAFGNPARVIRPLTEEEIASLQASAARYAEAAAAALAERECP